MKLNWKTFSLTSAAFLLGTVAASTSFAQDATAKFADWAPKMTAENMSDGAQVRAMEEAQTNWANYALRDAAKSPELRAEATKIAVDALAADYPAPTKAWLLHVLGWTGDDSCVDAVAAFLTSDDPRLFDEAARALAQIPTDKALNALQKAAADASDAKKAALETYIKARSVDVEIGVETEKPLALPVVSDAEFAEYIAGFAQLSDDDKARALGAVRVRKAKDCADLTVSALSSENVEVKRAALLALEKIATANEFAAMRAQFAFDRGFVVNIMKNVPGADFDAAVVAALKKETNADDLAALADVVGGRYITAEVATLLEVAKKDDCAVRLPLLTAAEQLATKANVGDFVDAFLAFPPGGDRDRAEQIIARLCAGDATPAIEKMTNENGAQIFPLLGRIGGPQALEQIERGLNSKNAPMIALSIRSLCNWPNAVVWERLRDAAQNEAYPEPLRIQALRAFVRVVSLPDDQDQIDMSGKDKLANLKLAFDLAIRDDERNLVLERVGAVREPESVEFALQHVDNAKLANKALNAILDLAHQDYLRKANKELFLKALDVVLEKGDQGQRDRAGNYKNAIK